MVIFKSLPWFEESNITSSKSHRFGRKITVKYFCNSERFLFVGFSSVIVVFSVVSLVFSLIFLPASGQVSILPSFYEQFFLYESVFRSFNVDTVWVCNFSGERKLAKKLLVKNVVKIDCSVDPSTVKNTLSTFSLKSWMVFHRYQTSPDQQPQLIFWYVTIELSFSQPFLVGGFLKY